MASTALVPLLLFDGVVTRWEAGGLLLIAFGYTGWMVHAARSAATLAAARLNAETAGEAADAAGAPRPTSIPEAAAVAAVGLAVLLVGGSFFVDGAVSVARSLGMSDRLVGLTIVAVGTSLPELVTSVIAARRGHSDLAVDNVVGSNIFNILLCLGAAGVAASVGAPLATVSLDVAALVLMTGLGTAFIRTERTITNTEGGLAVTLYAVYVCTDFCVGPVTTHWSYGAASRLTAT